MIDTAFTAHKFAKNRENLSDRWRSITIKGVVKVGTGISTGNFPLAAAADLSMVAYAKLEAQVAIEWESDYFYYAYTS